MEVLIPNVIVLQLVPVLSAAWTPGSGIIASNLATATIFLPFKHLLKPISLGRAFDEGIIES